MYRLDMTYGYSRLPNGIPGSRGPSTKHFFIVFLDREVHGGSKLFPQLKNIVPIRRYRDSKIAIIIIRSLVQSIKNHKNNYCQIRI